MNDRFKFKGYWYNDVQKEWWVYDNPQFITGDGTAQIWYDTEGGAYPELPSDAELHLCQCTGMKDKNGKLIYEGDIVRFQYGNGYRIGAVEVDKCDWRISNSNFCQGAWCGGALICLYETCEIIGNIYENKELLCQK